MNAIEFANVSKLYRLGSVSTGTLSHDLNRWWTMNILRQEDPYLKIGETNDHSHKGSSKYVWALKDISFKVEQGDVVGIIGKNGAGKSTLLKLLSHITAPTTGHITYKGRIASLLEVGTGFHPEMTGRENIYMNGAIMGMTKQEISRKLDEIVDFSGCERYIDTPVKRYSSGMNVRLGFAIAAHLEPEILVIDEVLAVGDAEFQKKAIGKMQEVSQGGKRTVLFVSHNMTAVRNLCNRGIVLNNGMIGFSGTVDDAIDNYLHTREGKLGGRILDNIEWTVSGLTFHKIQINGKENARSVIESKQEKLDVAISGHSEKELKTEISLVFKNEDEMPMATYLFCEEKGELMTLKGDFEVNAVIRLPKTLYKGVLKVDLYFHLPFVEFYAKGTSCCLLECEGFLYKFGPVISQKGSGLLQLTTYN